MSDSKMVSVERKFLESLMTAIEIGDRHALMIIAGRAKGILAAPAEDVRAVDEPVAYADPKAFENFKAGLATHEWMWSFPDTGLVPLYRHAQRETVMPERKDLPDLMMASWHEAKGWNACLDEFTRLNGATS